MQPCINQVTTLNASFEDDINGYADAACRAVEVWLTKLEQYLETHSVEDARRLLEGREMVPAAAAGQGGLLGPDGPQRRAAVELFTRRLELCRQLRIPTIVVAADLPPDVTGAALETAESALREVAALATQAGADVALEFQARSGFANNLESALALIEHIGGPGLGVCFDLFHYYMGPSKLEDMQHLTRENLLHVQVSDLSAVPRELAVDADRIMPGDGDFQIGPIVERLREIGYEGYVSLELMNPSIWQVPPLQVADVGMTALRKALGQAEI